MYTQSQEGHPPAFSHRSPHPAFHHRTSMNTTRSYFSLEDHQIPHLTQPQFRISWHQTWYHCCSGTWYCSRRVPQIRTRCIPCHPLLYHHRSLYRCSPHTFCQWRSHQFLQEIHHPSGTFYLHRVLVRISSVSFPHHLQHHLQNSPCHLLSLHCLPHYHYCHQSLIRFYS